VSLHLRGYIDLPNRRRPGGFDHAAVHSAAGRVYVAHTANDALDVLDAADKRYLRSIPNLTGGAGVLVSEEHNRVFTSNRGEDTVGVFSPDAEAGILKVSVGVHPNGLAFDPRRGHLLSANVGDPSAPNSFTLSVVDTERKAMIGSVAMPGRTRWAVYDPQSDAFYVNIAKPAQIVIVTADDPIHVTSVLESPAPGPHGLDLDAEGGRLFCACDARQLLWLELPKGRILAQSSLSGSPDVIFFNPALHHLYVAVGDPGVIDVFDTDTMQRIEAAPSEMGAHTIAFDTDREELYCFLPQTHRAAVYVDEG
jgi:DNA-binding beta-propeller fold protein YncE